MAAPRWTTIDELRDLHGWATPDPWCVTQLDDWAVLAEPDGDTVCGGLTEPDARLVVLLRNAFPGLLRDADKLATLAYGLRDIHHGDLDGMVGYSSAHCNGCGDVWPCDTIRLVNELAPEDSES